MYLLNNIIALFFNATALVYCNPRPARRRQPHGVGTYRRQTVIQ